MKRLFLALLIGAVCACSCNRNSVQTEQNHTEKKEGYGMNLPYFFFGFYKMFVLDVFHQGASVEDGMLRDRRVSLENADREVIWLFRTHGSTGYEGRMIEVPREEYDNIRKQIGDTLLYPHTDAAPPEMAFIRDFTEITLTSDAEYEEIPAGDPLNSIVAIAYVTCLPWIHNKYYDENGDRFELTFSTIVSSLADLAPEDLDGSAGIGKLIFPTPPPVGQSFTLLFKGGAAPFSRTFSF